MVTSRGGNLILNRYDAISSKSETTTSLPSVFAAACRDDAIRLHFRCLCHRRSFQSSQYPILLTGLASKSFHKKTEILVSLGCLNRRFILERKAQCFDPSCETFEGPFQIPTKLKI
jgi:hypothetical protein